MSVYVIEMRDGVKYMRPVLNREEYLRLRDSKEQQDILKAVRESDERQKNRLIHHDDHRYGYRPRSCRGVGSRQGAYP